MSRMPLDQLPDPTDKFRIEGELGTGFCAKVYKATDLQNDNRTVAIKIQPYDEERRGLIEEEYKVLRDYSSHPNVVDFYGAYREKSRGGPDRIWFILEYCEAGTAVDLVNKLLAQNKRMQEVHIAFVIREVAKATIELHRNHHLHRDIRGSNILLTNNGEIKLCDFGLTREVDSTLGKTGTCIGSPCWMAPEVVTAQNTRNREVYGSRCDVWSLGIAVIELADGRPPFFDMHPTRAMFQIVHNPPPTVFKPSNWSQEFNDFIAECLEKNPENRPYMMEIIEHPFLTEMIENEFALQQEIKHFIDSTRSEVYHRVPEVSVDRGFIKCYDQPPEKMYVEDLASIENPADSLVLEAIGNRLKMGKSYSFIGDILLSLNSNDLPREFDPSFHERYRFKSRSENAPHIFSVADLAYQDMLHHKEPQHCIFAGESYSGKSTNVHLFIEHLCFLGEGNRGATARVKKAIKAILSLTNAGTPLNNDSTRCCMQYHITFGSTGKLSGAIFLMNLLEKTRVSTTDMNQHNYHIFYYLYDFLNQNNLLKDYHLDSGRNYRYLRIPSEKQTTKLVYPRDDPEGNVERYKVFEEILNDMDISKQQTEMVRKVFAAILNLGNVRFTKGTNRNAEIEDYDPVQRVADLLRVDEKKFTWSLLNYCKVKGGIAERKQYTSEEARDARDAVAATIYQRIVDWLIHKMNQNLAFPRAVFGDQNDIVVYDMFGFECHHRNGLEQLMVNTINEQMQYHYNQKMFVNEMVELEMDGVPPITLNYHDNRSALDQLLNKPEGLFVLIDEATKAGLDHEAIIDKVINKRSQYIKSHSTTEISVSHFTGKLIYDVRNFVDTNRDFVPPEMVESLRTSLDEDIVLMFTNQLSKCGNLTMAFENATEKDKRRINYNLNTLSQGIYPQGNQSRTLSSVFRASCLALLSCLNSKGQAGGHHFIRCIRPELGYKPRNFHSEMVSQQLKALAVLDTILARQQGYSCRITYKEFLDRYQFLAFDFDETVDVTKDNCRLLMIRLKMEGWAIGKSKVFLRYYNDEFLARLYETQVKKIIKVQSMMRAYIARRRVKDKALGVDTVKPKADLSGDKDEAAVTIQKAYRGYQARQKYKPLIGKAGEIDKETAAFIRKYAQRWKSKSIYQVIMLYRAAKFQDLVNFSQQVHLYNQRTVSALNKTGKSLKLEKVDERQKNPAIFGPLPLPVKKLPFRLDEIPFYDTTYMCDPVSPLALYGVVASANAEKQEERWDAPLQQPPSLTAYLLNYNAYKKEQSCQTNWDREQDSDVIHNQSYVRDPRMTNRGSKLLDERTVDYLSARTGPANGRSVATSSSQYNRNHADNQSNYVSGSGSRRNSLYKKRSAPTPPPMSGMNNDSSWMSGGNSSNNIVKSTVHTYRPPVNPVNELQKMGRRNSGDVADDAPFNFKAMLRKTNYRAEENNNTTDYSRPTPRSFAAGASGSSTTGGLRRDENLNRQTNPAGSKIDMSSADRRESTASAAIDKGNYVEEEIAPGITLSGYAFQI